MEPTIITYTGDGKTKTFGFGFSFFQTNDIIVETNGTPTTAQYALQTAKPNPTADMPYTGGAVCFATAPAAGVEIKIYREFVMTRPGDFQPTAEIEAHHLNRELNFNLENMRDFRDRQHATNATVKEHDDKIAQIIECLSPAGGDISTTPGTPTTPPADTSEIEADITELQSQVATITTQMSTFATTTQMTAAENDIASLDTRVDGVEDDIAAITPRVPATPISTDNFVTKDSTTPQSDIDYVVASQMPSAANNYTWYRKYKSGWVEQGGQATTPTGADLKVLLPIPMEPNQFFITNSSRQPTNNWSATPCVKKSTDGTYIQIAIVPNTGNGAWAAGTIDWEVKGVAA